MIKKLIVLDLDGTTLKQDKSMSEYTIDTLLETKKEGNQIIFATARPPRDAYKYIPIQLKDAPIICYNGACIISSQELKVIYKSEISRKDVLKIIDIVESNGYINISIEVNDKLYSNFDTKAFFGNCENTIVDLKKMEYDSAYKIIICSKKAIDEEILESLPLTVKGMITDKKTLCQIINSNASKWTAIKYLASMFNINSNNIVAFGDDINDYEMIEKAGIGIAMGNADERIKKIARFIVDTNENDGVAKYLENKILQKGEIQL